MLVAAFEGDAGCNSGEGDTGYGCFGYWDMMQNRQLSPNWVAVQASGTFQGLLRRGSSKDSAER
jgi:hypothetical protein